jgi:nucleoside-triphosphatase
VKKVCLLTGAPGAGKTTIIRQSQAGTFGAGGFFSEGIREGRQRQGFRIVTLDGRTAVLARVDVASASRVGKYCVDVASLETVGVAALREAIRTLPLIVVDEIGKMELFSVSFRQAVTDALNSSKKVLGTIMLAPNPFTDAIKVRSDVDILEVTRTNRVDMLSRVTNWVSC